MISKERKIKWKKKERIKIVEVTAVEKRINQQKVIVELVQKGVQGKIEEISCIILSQNKK